MAIDATERGRVAVATAAVYPRVRVAVDFPRGWTWTFEASGRILRGYADTRESAQAIGDHYLVANFQRSTAEAGI